MTITTLFAAGAMLLGCNDKELLNPNVAFPAFSIIDGDTIKTRDDKAIKDKIKKYDKKGLFETFVVSDTVLAFKAPKKLKPAKLPDLTKHKNGNVPELKGKPFKLVAVGGSLTQGMRDGGIFNEGMLTSYPTLIANQMGIDFNNALFDPNEYNGLGRKVATSFNPTAGPVPKQSEVRNNLAVENGKLKQFKGQTDNYFLHDRGGKPLDELSKRFVSANHFFDPLKEGIPASFASQLKNNKLKFDLVFIEMGLQDIFGSDGLGGINELRWFELDDLESTKANSKVEIRASNMGLGGSSLYTSLFKLMVSQQINKGVVINCPDLEDLGFYRRNYLAEIEKLAKTYKTGTGLGDVQLVLATPQIDSLLSSKVNINSKPYISRQVNMPYSESVYVFLSSINRLFVKETVVQKNFISKRLSSFANMPLFDINTFYKEIHRGNITTIDGIKVDAKWPGGNFFSLDGIYPSAFGQAVIANEVIKTMNSFYKMDVPLIPCAEYLK